VAALNAYITRAKLQAAVGDSLQVHEAEHDRAIEAASRKIDEWTGRYFYQDAVASARVFRAKSRTCVCTGDFDATADVIVETDDDDDGVFETEWTVGQWQAEPFVRWNGKPHVVITTATRTREFPFGSRRPLVQVTAQWGWASVPVAVEQATEYLAILFFRAKDQYGVSIGITDDSREELSADPIKVAMELVKEYAVEGGTLYKPCSC